MVWKYNMAESKYTKELLEPIVKENNNFKDILKLLNSEVTKYKIDYLRRIIKKLNIDTSHLKKRKYSKELLDPIVKESKSIKEVLRKLNINSDGGGTHSHIKNIIKNYNIDTSHFTGRGWNKGNRYASRRRTAKEVLVIKLINSNKEPSSILKRSLIEIGRLYRCECCGLDPLLMWNNKPIVLEIDHKNGDGWDNREENLRFICPNCHSQTENYCGRKLKKKRIKCSECYNEIKGIKSITGLCLDCYNKNVDNIRNKPKPHTYKVPHPSKEELETLMKTHNWTKLGKMFGVTDNAVKKWAISYGITWKKQKYTKNKALQILKF
jgi:gas vesicle protein